MNYKNHIKYDKLVSKKQNGFYIFSTSILILFSLSSTHAFLSQKSTFKIDESLAFLEQINGEHVVPIKVNDFSLDAEELFVEPNKYRNVHINNYKKDLVKVRYNITSTYRHKSSLIWDPNPEYIINAFGHQMHLVLQQDSSFIQSETYRFTKFLENNIEEDIPSERTFFDCYYNGYVKGDKQSEVAVSLCHGMTGYIKTNFGSLFIQPINEATDFETSFKTSTTSKILHKIWLHSKPINNSPVGTDFDDNSTKIYNNYYPTLERMKRDLKKHKPLTIELLIAVDNTMLDFHRNNLESYIMTLISVASKLFQDPSLGNPIRISVANIIIVNRKSKHLSKMFTKSIQTLNEFIALMKESNYYYDAALFLTRRNICERPCTDIGMARMGSICTRSACAVIHDRGLATSFTIAHELGHIFNIPHDDEDACRAFTKSNEKGRIMYSGTSENTWSWSKCSRHYISEFLKRGQKCMKDLPNTSKRSHNTRYPGEIYSVDRQCYLINGNESLKACYIGNDCTKLWCHVSGKNSCLTFQSPWADGTACNRKKSNSNYWCQSGKCIPRR